jgi:hypothetical protein
MTVPKGTSKSTPISFSAIFPPQVIVEGATATIAKGKETKPTKVGDIPFSDVFKPGLLVEKTDSTGEFTEADTGKKTVYGTRNPELERRTKADINSRIRIIGVDPG